MVKLERTVLTGNNPRLHRHQDINLKGQIDEVVFVGQQGGAGTPHTGFTVAVYVCVCPEKEMTRLLLCFARGFLRFKAPSVEHREECGPSGACVSRPQLSC